VDMEGSFVVVYWLFGCGILALLLWYIGSFVVVHRLFCCGICAL